MNAVPTPPAAQRLRTLSAELRTLADSGELDYYSEHRVRELVDLANPRSGCQSTNPLICDVVEALRLLAGADPAQATEVLNATGPGMFTDREYAEVLGWLGHTRRTCSRCGGRLLFVADGPQPGWWEHQLVPDDEHPCGGALPEVTRR